MHLLAHALCGADDELLRVGQVAGDFVKGRDLSAYPATLATGIRHHRLLDSATDQHEAVKRSRARLHGAWRRYAGVLVDLAYGHLLARNWDRWGTGSLHAFESSVHADLARHHNALPPRLQAVRERLYTARVLSGIGDADGVALACDRLSHRLPALSGGADVVAREQLGLARDFEAFWPDVLVLKDRLLSEQ